MQQNNQRGLSLASSTWGQEEIAAVESVLYSGQFTMGANVLQSEQDFARYIGTNFAVMVNSGSSANLLALAALNFHSLYKLPKGVEVIVPMVSWSTTFYPVNQAGYKLVFVDVSADDWNLNLDLVEKAVNEKTGAIFAVNLLGAPADLVGLQKICEKYKILLLEDNCESLGAELRGKKTGSFGLMGTHSTFFSHHICTMEGGYITTDDDECYQILLSLRAHGWTRNLPFDNLISPKSGDPFEDSFTFVLPGYNVRPLEIEGAIGIQQIRKIDSFVEARIENAEYLSSNLKSPFFKQQLPRGKSSWFGFGFVVDKDAPFTRADVLAKLAQAQIETRPIVAGNFLRNPVIKHLDYRVEGNSEQADKLHDFGFFVGNHHVNVHRGLDQLIEILSGMGDQ